MCASPVRVGGWLPERERDPHDLKEEPLSAVIGQLVEKPTAWQDEFILPEYTPISNQLSLGSCVANAWADALEIMLGIDLGEDAPQLSRLFLYWTARCKSQLQHEDRGCFIRDAARQLLELGIPRESTWAYVEDNVFTSPPLEAFNEASEHQIRGLFRIDGTGQTRIDEVEACLRFMQPVVFGTAVGQDFADYNGSQLVFDPPISPVGRHAMIIVGMRTRLNGAREFRVRNSWGEEWGDKGHAWISEAYLCSNQTSDLWMGTTTKDLLP